jgi:hypothetical protein
MGPAHVAVGFDPNAGPAKLEAQPDALLRAQWSHSLHGCTITIEVADDATITGVEHNVGQVAQLLPIVTAGRTRGKRYDLHTLRQSW